MGYTGMKGVERDEVEETRLACLSPVSRDVASIVRLYMTR